MPLPGDDASRLSLLTDLYELTMLEAYLAEGMTRPATFSLFVRRLPPSRRFLLAAGLDDLLDLLAELRFDGADVAWLEGQRRFSPRTLDWLRRFRFHGEVRALPEGMPFFESEPLVEVTGPLPEAQLIETLVMNQLEIATLAASKAIRITLAAQGRGVVDFGVRRMQGADASLKVARAAFLAGAQSTSNVLAGRRYDLPLAGTMAHSFVQACASEAEAFAAMTRAWPETTLLVDTYDTLEGVREVIRLARRQGAEFRVRGVRLDSGDLLALSRESRRLLDAAGLRQVTIFASGGLDEHEIDRLVRAGAPIDAFGVGTALGVSDDAPALDLAYKLVEYDGRPRTKLSTGKVLWPGRKQAFRELRSGAAVADTLALHDERLPGQPLLVPVMAEGRRLQPRRALRELQAETAARVRTLPAPLRSLDPAVERYPVHVSGRLRALADAVAAEHGHASPRAG